ncbi:MAG TPA: hypothetical protein VEV64_08270, partial [Rhizomicrobium sp.]|nr:hypothetical protein [Rhizomicrobium sp.]
MHLARIKKSVRIGALSAVVGCACVPGHGAADPAATSPILSEDQADYQGFFNNPSFLVVPIPISNPTIGSGLGLATAMFFKSDKDSKSSFFGTGAFFTSNGSWGAAMLGDVAFDEDRYHTRGTTGYANVKYDFYGTQATNAGSPRHVSLNQSGALFQALFEGRVARDFYVGGQLRLLTVKTK